MAPKTNVPGERQILDESFEANEDLSSSEHRVVVAAGSVTAGKSKAGLPGGQGVAFIGVMLNDPASGAVAEVRVLGEALVEANSTFNAGVELTISGTDGKVESASAGDYIVGIAKEASAEANQLVTVIMPGIYQKN